MRHETRGKIKVPAQPGTLDLLKAWFVVASVDVCASPAVVACGCYI